MTRIVVDKNMLEDLKNLGAKHPLRAWLGASKDHIVVVTDYAHLEMLKGNALKNILKSTEILAEFPKQVHIVKSITAVSALRGKAKGRKKRMTSGRGTKSFRKWRDKRAHAAEGHQRFEGEILRNGERASKQFADMLENMNGFADNIKDATKEFTDDELGILRCHESVPHAIVLKILGGTLKLADSFFLMHPDIRSQPKLHDVPHTFIFRFALCAFLHALHWRVKGGAEDRLPERMRNDVIDVSYAAYALCFDGILTDDKLANEIYDNGRAMLDLFTEHAPKAPRKRGKGAGAGPKAEPAGEVAMPV